jgi:hypothetical protein
MKSLILALALITSSGIYAQIGESQSSVKEIEVGKVERYTGNYYTQYTFSFLENKRGDRVYILAFTNERTLYESDDIDMRFLNFRATQDELDYLYDFLLQGFEENQIRALEVGQDIIETSPLISKFLYIYVYFNDGTVASLKLKKRQLARLFGRR